LRTRPTSLHPSVQTAQLAFDALDRSDWPGFVALIHPDALSLFHRQYVAKARSCQQDGSLIAHIRHNPALDDFVGIASVDQLEAMQPDDCLVEYLATQERVRSHNDEFRADESRRVVGVVEDDVAHVHVVYRLWTRGTYVDQEDVHIVTASPSGSDWRLMLNREWREAVFRALGQSVEMALQQTGDGRRHAAS
jgi:hypothetical protein